MTPDDFEDEFNTQQFGPSSSSSPGPSSGPSTASAGGSRPEIEIRVGEMQRAVDEAEAALIAAQPSSPVEKKVFRRGRTRHRNSEAATQYRRRRRKSLLVAGRALRRRRPKTSPKRRACRSCSRPTPGKYAEMVAAGSDPLHFVQPGFDRRELAFEFDGEVRLEFVEARIWVVYECLRRRHVFRKRPGMIGGRPVFEHGDATLRSNEARDQALKAGALPVGAAAGNVVGHESDFLNWPLGFRILVLVVFGRGW